MLETDDDDFTLSSSSKLSLIFNTTSVSDESNASLTYKAPKQPKPPGGNLKESEAVANCESGMQVQSSVILAKVVTLWKLDSGKNKPMGIYMVAIIGDPSRDIFEVIIYQDKTKIMIREILGKSLTFYKYPNNFVAFYDNQKQLWNLYFDNSESKESFLQFAGKCNCPIVDQNEEGNHRAEKDSSVSNSSLVIEPKKAEVVPSEPDVIAATKGPSSKEKILSRITKMGQQILPRTVDRNRSSELSDSETESSYSDHRPSKPVTAPRKFKRNLNNHEKALAPILPESNGNFTPYIPPNSNCLIPNNQMALNSCNTGLIYSQPLPDYGLSNFIIAQNAELKANLSELNTKLNNVLSSTDNNGNKEDFNTLNSQIKFQNLKIENLSTDLTKSRKALKELRKKCDDKCEQLVKELSKREHLENIDVEVNILREKVQNVGILQNEVEQGKTELREKDKEIAIQCEQLKDLENYYKASECIKENLLKENNDLRIKLDEITLKINDYEEEIKQKENDLNLRQDKSSALDKENINKVVKESMNEAFRSIMENFDENDTYSFQDIQGVLLHNLKQTSYRLMNSLL